MKIDVKNEKVNPFLKRKEIMIDIDHNKEPTPSKEALRVMVSKELKCEKEKIEIIYIFSEYGLSVSKAKVFLWEEKVMKEEGKKEEIPKESEPEKQDEKSIKEEKKESEKEEKQKKEDNKQEK